MAALAGMLSLLLGACAQMPRPEDEVARESGMRSEEVVGTHFRHRVYTRASVALGRSVHVYLEGDGTPWSTPFRVASDPSPHDPLALRMMSLDMARVVYVGRPCYHGMREDAGCSAELWTDGRYSERVVDSMQAAIGRIVTLDDQVTLIGYSGGGVLAVLLAERMANVKAVVTLAANLDLAAWTGLHGYTPLRSSLDPATRAPLAASIRQLHVAGGVDAEVPAWITHRFATRQARAEVRILADADHRCCWIEAWRNIVATGQAWQ